jgi:hypothetical protein
MEREKSLIRSVSFGLAILLGMIIYAYGFNVTKVNFETTRSEKRLTQLSRIMRALAHPSLFVYEKEELEVMAPIYLPCPKTQVQDHNPDTNDSYLILTPNCAGPGEIITVEGYNIWPNTKGPINFLALSGVNLTIGNLQSDANGYFKAKVKLPKRQPVDVAQMIRALPRRNIGNPALLATTFGTLLAIPVSFFAARNLMSSQKSSLTNVAFSTIGWPLGILIGLQTALTFKSFVIQLLVEDILIRSSIGSVLGIGLTWTVIQWLFPKKQDQPNHRKHKIVQSVTVILCVLISILTIYMIANLALVLGQALIEPLGPIGFVVSLVMF